MNVNPGQVILITGDSGSGKSTLLREIITQIKASKKDASATEFGHNAAIVTNESIQIPDDELIVEGVGKDLNEAISILSMAGLNEAFLMLRKFKELSDGQKYRYRIAKMIASRADVWAFDEFTAVLDRVTAKVVSYTVQKTARKFGKTLLCATTHEDLLPDLKPDLSVRKLFGESVSVSHFQRESFDKECTLLKEIKIEECPVRELEEVREIPLPRQSEQFREEMFQGDCTRKLEPVAGIVYVTPHLQLKGRNFALPEFKGRSDREMGYRVNKFFLRIARVIVAPKFRSIGLGAEIVRRTMPLVNVKYVETLAIMARYNPFFEHAGMTRVDVPDDYRYNQLLDQIESFGIKRELLAFPEIF